MRANAIDPDPRVEKEIRALLSAGFECSCVGWNRLNDTDEDVEIVLSDNKCVKVHLIGISSAFGTGLRNAPKIFEFERKLYTWLIDNFDMYDVVHACDLDTGLAAMSACKRMGKPLVYDIFDFYCDSRIMPNWIKSPIRKLEFSVIEQARATIICTNQRRAQLAGSKPRQIVVVENTPEEIYVSKHANNNTGYIKLAYIGVLTEGRFICDILDTVDQFDDLLLDIGGFGPLQDEIIERSRDNGRITFYGKTPYSKTLKIESEADVMFGLYDPEIANHRMAAPNKYYESLMLGTPLIAIEGTSVGTWVTEELTGAVLNPSFTCEELYQAIRRVYSENLEGSISARQKDLYRNRHSWNLMARRLCTLYEEVETELADGGAR